MLRLVRDEDAIETEQMEEQDVQADSDRQTVQQQDAGDVEGGADESDGEPQSDAASVNSALLEALLLSTHHPLTAGRLAELMDLAATKPVRQAIKDLNQQYESAGRAFRIEQVAGGYQILTL